MKHQVERSLLDVTLDREAATATGRCRFAPELTVFAGHFPQSPIVPGVFLIETTRLLAERLHGRRFRIAEITSARFTAEVHPGVDLYGRIETRSRPPGRVCEAEFHLEGASAAKIRLVLADS